MSVILASLPAERPGVPASPELLEKRAMFAPATIDPAMGITVTERSYAGVPCRVLNEGGSTTVLHLHGGGYRMGSAAAYDAYGASLARAGSVRVVLPDYRLAPEHPFPAGLRDACAVYEALAAENEAPIVVSGDSAGAGLAAAVAASAIRTGVRNPDGLLVLSPWLDVRCVSEYYQSATDVFFPLSTAASARDDYLQGTAADHPLASPLLGDLDDFPRALIQVGAREALVGDAVGLAAELADLDITCTLEVVAGQGHTWPLIDPDSVESIQSISSAGRFLASFAG